MIIDRHLVRQVAMPCFSVSVVLLLIFMGFSLSRFLNQADAGLLNTAEVISLTAFKVLIALEVLLPIGLFFGLMLGLGKLHNDSEIYAMRASGMSESRMIRPIILLATMLALLIAALSLYVRPWAYAQTYELLALAEASSDIERIRAGQFYITTKKSVIQKPESEQPSSVKLSANGSGETGAPGDPLGSNATIEIQERAIFVEKISKHVLNGIFIRTRVGEELQVISSREGIFDTRIESESYKLELHNARIFKHVLDGPDLFANITHFTMNIANEPLEMPAYKAKSVISSILQHSDDPGDRAEFQWRISTPISTLLLALLAIPLSRSKPRHGRYAKLLLALVVYAAYFNLIGIGRTWVEQETAEYIWWVPGLLCFVVVLAFIPWDSLIYILRRGSNDQRHAV